MMGHRERLISGDEYDCLTRARRFYRAKAGKFSRVKRAFNRRIRKITRLELRHEHRLDLAEDPAGHE